MRFWLTKLAFVTFGGSNTEYKDAYLLLSTADTIKNEYISISKQAFLPWMPLSLHKTTQKNLVSIAQLLYIKFET